MVYLDNNATTRPSTAVVETVHDAMEEYWANPSSVHRAGQAARQQVELARREISELIHVAPREITFTSGGTESINLGIRGVLRALPASRRRLVTTRIEHASIRDVAAEFEKDASQSLEAPSVAWAPITREGLVDLGALPSVVVGAGLMCVQWANNETGVVQPVREIAAICREKGVLLLLDATQWVGKEPIGEEGPACDMLVCAAHKFHGPKGVGVLWTRSRLGFRPIAPGSQELGRRGGTENVAGIIGAGMAAREASAWLGNEGERGRLARLRDAFEERLLRECPGSMVNGARGPGQRLWNTTNIGFPRLESEALLLILSERGVYASAGAACSSGSLEPSPVLLAMGIASEIAHGSLRFSLSRETTEAEVNEGAEAVIEAVRRLGRVLP